MAEREYVAIQEHFSNFLHRRVVVGEPVFIPEDEAKRNPTLYEDRKAGSKSGPPAREDLMEKAVKMNLGKEDALKKLPYTELLALVKSKE